MQVINKEAHEAFDNNLHPGSWNISINARLGEEAVSGEVLADIAQDRDDVIVLTADLMFSNRMSDFAKVHPNKFFNFGISEQNMVAAAAGLATTGKKPYVASFASFLALLCCEQIRTSVAYPKLPVRILAHHAGMTMGFYGTSHHALEDLSILRSMADMTIICPSDRTQIRAALESTVDYDGPIYFRLGRGREPLVYEDGIPEFKVGKAIKVREGNDMTIITNGLTLAASVDAADQLKEEGISVQVLDMHTIKPFDEDAVKQAVKETGRIMTVEEHSVIGGIGSCVAEILADNGLTCKFGRHGVYDEYALIGPPKDLYKHYQLDAKGVANKVKEFFK
ncbi:transketolase family protein [Siminovitchia sediminis]|uniref:Transketolase family protein n=1 Tax=Siminovitchia sediminis TaxID=1274353 RepID=A0ABW4KMB1_9BACI